MGRMADGGGLMADDGRRTTDDGGRMAEDGAYGPSQTHGLESPCHVEDFARWSRDALVADVKR